MYLNPEQNAMPAILVSFFSRLLALSNNSADQFLSLVYSDEGVEGWVGYSHIWTFYSICQHNNTQIFLGK